MTAPVRAPAPSRALSRAPRGTTAAAPATLRRAGAAAPNRMSTAPRGVDVAAERRRAPEAPARPAARPSLRLVDDRRLQVASRRRSARALLVVTGLLVIASLFGVVVFHAVLVSGQGRLDGLQQQVAEEQSRYQALRLEVAELEAPGRIVEVAQGRLGMVSPSEIRYLTPVPLSTATPDPEPASASASAPWATIKPLLGGQG